MSADRESCTRPSEDYELDILIGQGRVRDPSRCPSSGSPSLAQPQSGAADLAAAFAVRHRASPRVLRVVRHERDRAAVRTDPRRADCRCGGCRSVSAVARDAAIANRLLRRVREFAQVRADGTISLDVAHSALKRSKWTRTASTSRPEAVAHHHRQVRGGPVGVNSIAAAISEERDAIEDIYEPPDRISSWIERRASRPPRVPMNTSD